MPIITKDGYTLTKEVLPQEYASVIPPLSITSDKIATDAVFTDAIQDEAVTDVKCAEGFALVPRGGIILWHGATTDIPTGWYLCDGTNGTPDLRNKFIVGAGSTYSVAATGGSADAIVVSHTHSISDPGHAHTIQPSTQGSGGSAGVQGAFWNGASTSTNTTGISINSTGSSATNANLPPYYALAYIMRGI